MASPSDSWMKEFNEASKLADEINAMILEKGCLLPSGPDTQRHFSAIRRKITILNTRLKSLQPLLSQFASKQPITDKEMHQRQDLLTKLTSKANQMTSTLNKSNFANRDSLLGEDIKSADIMNRANSLNSQGLVGFQQQVMREQDEGLENLEATILSTKHIALAVNEELELHTRLIDSLDIHIDSTDSQLRRVQKRLSVLNKNTKGVCSCMRMLFLVILIVLLAIGAWALVKYL